MIHLDIANHRDECLSGKWSKILRIAHNKIMSNKMSTQGEDTSSLESEESLLYSARHGQVEVVKALLEARNEGTLTLNINCKGQSKTNMGWTPLQLATYFGHKAVVQVLLDAHVNIDDVNDLGDTALHKASFTGNEELVVLLLQHGADVHVINGEGKLPRDVCNTQNIYRMLMGAEQAERRETERRLLTAAKEGRLDEINGLLCRQPPPSINCVDAQGNTSLHGAAYRGHAHVAVILLQNGIDSTIRNKSGQLAMDLARDEEMREVLSVRPVQRLQRSATRFEGQLLRRSRFLGWRPQWAVLQRGVLMYFSSRAEAASGNGRWRTRKYLDGASVVSRATEPALFLVNFSDGDSHRLAVPHCADPAALRQSWITALNEHISYSGHYLWAGVTPETAREASEEPDEEECRPLGSMQDALTAATNSLALLETQLKECGTIVAALDKTATVGNAVHQSACMRFQHVCGTGEEALNSLKHCAILVTQAREADNARLRREIERNRVLEEALAALARTHHALEMSFAEEITNKSKKKKMKSSEVTNNENFYDVCEADSDSDTLVTAGLSSPLGALSPWDSTLELTPHGSPLEGDKTPTNDIKEVMRGALSNEAISSQESLHTALSPASSLGTLVSHGGHVYRNARSHLGLHRPSSQWSI